MTLNDYLRSQPGRCAGCGFHEVQGCACPALAAKHDAQSATLTARSSDAAKVEQAIRQLAATGRPFSANDARHLHGIRGGVVGATFTSLRQAGVIRACGDEVSTDKATHGHRIFQWIGVAA